MLKKHVWLLSMLKTDAKYFFVEMVINFFKKKSTEQERLFETEIFCNIAMSVLSFLLIKNAY